MSRLRLSLLYFATIAAIAALAWRGRDYYALPLLERPHHELHWDLKPGGEVARWYGVTGFGLLVAMLGYSVRKRVPALSRLGRLRAWLDFHIWCGVTGPLLIVLHSALKVGGLIAIAFWSMIAVALSGIFGRYLYAFIPRDAGGLEVPLAGAALRDRRLVRRVQLFHYWHVFHKPFAALMYLFAAVHIAVAWLTGYAGVGG
jgi:hypothetical protein